MRFLLMAGVLLAMVGAAMLLRKIGIGEIAIILAVFAVGLIAQSALYVARKFSDGLRGLKRTTDD